MLDGRMIEGIRVLTEEEILEMYLVACDYCNMHGRVPAAEQV